METKKEEKIPKGAQKATFAAGCFWGVEELFRLQKGVLSTKVGYIGGHLDDPTYEQVCTDRSGHAEAVEVLFDPNQVSYTELLGLFWKSHDPTQLNRQGPDRGTQYRSAIFFHDQAQKKIAQSSKKELENSPPFKGKTIVTLIEQASTFFDAEDYHQKYLLKRGMNMCH